MSIYWNTASPSVIPLENTEESPYPTGALEEYQNKYQLNIDQTSSQFKS